MSDFSAFDNALRSLESIPLARVAGRLVRLNGILLESVGCPLMTGQLCRIESANHTLIDAQAVGFNRDITYLMPFKQPVGLMAGARVFPEEKAHDILIGESWLGRVVNGLGEPLDGKGRLNGNDLLPPLPPFFWSFWQPVSASGTSRLCRRPSIRKAPRIWKRYCINPIVC